MRLELHNVYDFIYLGVFNYKESLVILSHPRLPDPSNKKIDIHIYFFKLGIKQIV